MTDPQRRDPATYNEASESFDPTALDSIEDILAELLEQGGLPAIVAFVKGRIVEAGPSLQVLEIRMLAAVFFEAAFNPSKLWGLGRALNLDKARHVTDEQIGDAYAVSKAAISKEARQWLKLLGLPPPPTMKSERACASYRRIQLARSARAKISA